MELELEEVGRVWRRNALSEKALKVFDSLIDPANSVGGRPSHFGLSVPIFWPVTQLAASLLKSAKPVRCITFNKTQGMNWALPWHQDRVIAVDNKTPQAGYTNWSQKSGIWHCEPPVSVLNNMIFARIHLNDTDEENGCLELSLGSHKRGKMLSKDIAAVISELPTELCKANRGDVLFVKALTLHRSKVSRSNRPRKAVRVDYANGTLPDSLKWAFD